MTGSISHTAPTTMSELDLSLGEFQALVTKAFKGCGYSWGLAEEGAWACRQLATWGHSPVPVLLELLADVEAQTLQIGQAIHASLATAKPICPITLGAAISDGYPTQGLEITELHQPLLLVPFLTHTAGASQTVSMTWSTGRADVSRTGMILTADPPSYATVRLTQTDQQAMPAVTLTRAKLTASDLAVLEQFAHRTYAPATEASRRMGAG